MVVPGFLGLFLGGTTLKFILCRPCFEKRNYLSFDNTSTASVTLLLG